MAIIELFAGAGGLALGIEKAGFIIGRGTVSGLFLCWKKIRT